MQHMRTTPYTTEEIKKLKESGKYYKDNPETMRLRFLRNNDYGKNTIGSIAYKMAGGQKLYFAMPKDERLQLRAIATEQYKKEQPHLDWTRTKRKLPKVDRPKSIRITTKKVVDSRGYVYIFKDHMKSDGLYKIGASYEPQKRLDQANVWGDFESIYESEEVADCAKLEKEVHQSLRKHQVKGEWFKVSEDLAINTIKELVNESFNYAVAS